MNVPPTPPSTDEPPDDRPAATAAGQSGDASDGESGVEGGGRDGVPAEGFDAVPDEGRGTGFMAVLQSVAAAGIGVQSSRNRKRDFEHGKPVHFIVGGLIGTALLLLAVWLFVRVLLATAPG